MKLKHIPNVITSLRFILVLPFLSFLLAEHYDKALYVFLVAGLSDGIDGFLARHFSWTSYFGAFMDPLADKCLMMSSFVALAHLGLLPFWLCVIVILRDIVIMSGVGGIYYIKGHIDFEPSMISKVNTGFQVALICLILFKMTFWPLPEWIVMMVIAVVTVTTITSLFGYVWVGLKQLIYGRHAQ